MDSGVTRKTVGLLRALPFYLVGCNEESVDNTWILWLALRQALGASSACPCTLGVNGRLLLMTWECS